LHTAEGALWPFDAPSGLPQNAHSTRFYGPGAARTINLGCDTPDKPLRHEYGLFPRCLLCRQISVVALDNEAGNTHAKYMPTTASVQVQVRRQRLLDLLPEHGWSIPKAGVAAGYKPSYAERRLPGVIKADVAFCEAISAKRREMEATQGDKIEKLVRSWEKIADDPNVATRDRLKAGELLGKYYAMFTEKRVLETPQRQRELDESQQRQVRIVTELMRRYICGQLCTPDGRDVRDEIEGNGQHGQSDTRSLPASCQSPAPDN
jgi:hypothetical protein